MGYVAPNPIMLGPFEGVYRSESAIRGRCLRFFIPYHAPKMAAITTTAPTPAPIPAFAPVERPPPPPEPPLFWRPETPVAVDVRVEVATYVVAGITVSTTVETVCSPVLPSAEVVGITVVSDVDVCLDDTEEMTEVKVLVDDDAKTLVSR